MKKIIYSFIALSFLVFTSVRVDAQCSWRGVLNAGAVTPGCNAFGTQVALPSTSYRTLSVVTGVSYSVSTCGGPWDSQLTGFNGTTFVAGTYNDDGGPSCTGTLASFNWTATYSGTLNVQVERFSCGATWEATSAVLQVRQNSTVSNTTSTATICRSSTKTCTATLGGTHSNPTINWSVVAGSGTFSSTTGSSVTFTPTSNGTITVRATVGVCTSDVSFTVDALSTLGTLTNGTTRQFCNATGEFGPTGANIGIPTVSGQTGSVIWDWGSNNGAWNTGWISGATSGTCCFPKQVGTSNTDADRVRYRVTNGVCPAVTSGDILISNYQNEAPTSLATSDNNFCSNVGGTLNLTATFPANINMRGVVRFYSGSCGGTLVGTVTPSAGSATAVLNIAKPTSTTTYYARYEPGAFTGCSNTACASVTVTVTTLSVAPTGATGTTTICNGNSTTLTVSGGSKGTGAVTEWFTGSCGGTSAGTGDAITVSPGTTTTYYVRYSGTCNTTTCATVTVTVNTLSVAPTGATGTTTICNGNSTTLTVSGGSKGTGATTQWFTGSCGGTSAGTGDAITVSPSTTTTYYVRYSGTCNTTTCATVTVTVNTLSVAPTGATGTTTICNGNSTTLTVSGGSKGTGAVTQWFTGSCGGTSAGTGDAITVSPSTTTTYYVRYSGTCNTTTCATVTVTVNTLSVAPTGATGTTTICNGNSTTLTVSGGSKGTGAVTEWFTGSCGGTLVGTADAITVSPSTTTTYYVRYSGTCNTTTCATVTVTVNTLSVAPTGATGTTTICNGNSTTLTVSGGSKGTGAVTEWFTGSCGGTSAGTGDAITVSPGTTTTYYVRYSGTCNTTTCATVTVTVNTLSVAPTGATGTTTICNGNSTTLTVSGGSKGTGAVTEWFTGSCGGTSAGTGDAITVSPGTTTTYYVRYSGTCNTTTCATVTVTVDNPITTLTATASPNPVCDNSTLTLTASNTGGTNITWSWSGPAGFSAVTQNTTRSSLNEATHEGVYTVKAINACHPGPGGLTANTASVNIHKDFGFVSSVSVNPNPVCEGSSITLIANFANGTPADATYSWTGPNSFSSSAASPTRSNMQVADGGSYNVTVSNACHPGGQNNGTIASLQPVINATIAVDECMGTSPTDKYYLLVTGSGGTGTLSYSGTPVISVGNQKVYYEPAGSTVNVTITDQAAPTNCSKTVSVTAPSGHPINIPLTANVTSSVSVNCYDVDLDRWVTFRDNSNNAILSINDNINGGAVNNNLGLVNVTVYKDAVEPTTYTTGPNCQTFTDFKAMKRHFVITTTNPPTSGEPVGVRLYFTQAEADELKAATLGNNGNAPGLPCTQNDDFSDNTGLTDLFVTKYSGPNEDNLYTNNLSSGTYRVFGTDFGIPGSPDGPLTKAPNQFSSVFSGGPGYHYVQLQVTEFSEFWLHGSYHGAPLPVEMIYFQAEAVNNSYIQLTWATAIEIDNDGFIVERSVDAQTWSNIGWVEGHDNATTQHDYSFNDYNVEPNVRYYYRLKQLDNDGDYEYTTIVSEMISTQSTFAVKDFIPNPTMNNTSLIVSSSEEQVIEVKFYDIIGQVVSSSEHSLHKGGNQITFSLEHLSAGTYTAIVTSNNEVYSKKLVVTR